MLSALAITEMESLPWFAGLRPEVRATVGLLVQENILTFTRWLQRLPETDAVDLGELFAVAPVEMSRAITLEQTVTLIRAAADAMECAIGDLAEPGDEAWLHGAVMQFFREFAFAAAFIYARAAERRGTWDARLEALVVDAIRRGDQDDWLLSRATALGWTTQEQIVVIAGWAPKGTPETVLQTVQHTARHAGLSVLAGVHGRQLITVVADVPDPLTAAKAVLQAYGAGPVVVGPAVSGLMRAHHSAAVALAGSRAAPMRPDTPRPVVADDLLPERALDGDPLARHTLLEEVYRPLLAAGEVLLETVSAYLQTAHSMEMTARQLFVHHNTVRYRLRRAAQACGQLATRPRDAYVLQIALALGRRDDHHFQAG
jgi:PucR C-terminal helix-turn-helix domain/GGDEF-like domain